MFGSKKTVVAKTRAEVDEGLRTADNVVVEGDDELLSYAATQAANFPGGVESVTVSPGPMVEAVTAAADLFKAAGETVGEPRKARRGRSWLAPFVAAVVVIGLAVAGLLTTRHAAAPPPSAPAADAAATATAAAPAPIHPAADDSGTSSAPETPASPPDSEASTGSTASAPPSPTEAAPEKSAAVRDVLVSLAWPFIALVAVVGMFLLARQAISRGNDVKIEWKITDKAHGRLVISKQQQRVPRRRAAQAA